MKKYIKKLFSMKTALAILALLILACIAGSVISQGYTDTYYTENYSSFISTIILGLGLDDVFHVWWFVGLTIFLCINLLGCNLIRFPAILRQMKSYDAQHFTKNEVDVVIENDPKGLFEKMGFHKIEETTKDGYTAYYSVKNKFGLWGAWLTHLGMLIIIVGFALGQMYTQKYTVYGVKGQTKEVEGTNLSLTIDDFNIYLREDETVEQYVANVTVTDLDTNESESGETSVNNPCNLLGYKVYQNSTGWAATIEVRDEDDNYLESDIVCAGEYMRVDSIEGLYVVFRSFYPDYVNYDGQPYTLSSNLNNPAYLYMLYYDDQVLGMNILEANEKITIDGYSIIFKDPQQYTLLQLKTDPYTWIPAVGAVVILLGIFLSFYLRTAELYAIEKDGKWNITGYSKKGGVLFHDQLLEEANKLLENSQKEE